MARIFRFSIKPSAAHAYTLCACGRSRDRHSAANKLWRVSARMPLFRLCASVSVRLPVVSSWWRAHENFFLACSFFGGIGCVELPNENKSHPINVSARVRLRALRELRALRARPCARFSCAFRCGRRATPMDLFTLLVLRTGHLARTHTRKYIAAIYMASTTRPRHDCGATTTTTHMRQYAWHTTPHTQKTQNGKKR